MQSFAVVLDANVIVPVAATDLLLRLAEREFYRPLWSARILDETFHAITKIHPELTESQIRSRLVAMNDAFEGALITGWERIEAALDLPDENDRHVLACAIVGGADAIVTNNVDDFPVKVLALFGLEAIGLDDFLLDLIDHAPREVAAVILEMAQDTKNPAISTSDILGAVARAGAPRAASGSHHSWRTEPTERVAHAVRPLGGTCRRCLVNETVEERRTSSQSGNLEEPTRSCR